MTRGLASAGDPLDEVKLAILRSDGEDNKGVFATIAGIEEESVGGDGEFGGSVFIRGKIGRDGFNGGVGVDQKSLRVVGEACCGPEIVVEGGIYLIDAVDPAAVGVEDDVPRARAGVVVSEDPRIGEVSGLGVD